MHTEFNPQTARQLLVEAQQKALEAIAKLHQYIELTDDQETADLVRDKLLMATTKDRPFFTSARSLDDVIAKLDEQYGH